MAGAGGRRIERERCRPGSRDAFDALDDDVKIDLLNLLRFPRSNIALCAALLARLRDRPHRWPGLAAAALLADAPVTVVTLASELDAGPNDGIRPTADHLDGEAEPTRWGQCAFGYLYLPVISLLFPDDLDEGADEYGGHALQFGDDDAALRWGGVAEAGPVDDHVRQLQADLAELGYGLVGAADGGFGIGTEQAVREFQIYAKMRFIAIQARAGPRYLARLDQALNLLPYSGPISGVVNTATRIAIHQWKAKRWRCPVVVEAWGTTRTAGNVVPTRTQPIAGAGNVWLYNEVQTASPARSDDRLFFVRDFAASFPLAPGRQPDLTDPDDLIDLGCYTPDPDLPSDGGPMTRPTYLIGTRPVYPSVWAESEVLPEHLVGVPLADLDPAQLATFRVVRAVAEVECLGFLDCVNCYDTAFVSMGPAHWTLGLSRRRMSEGEMCGYLAYLTAFDGAAFHQGFERFGMRIAEPWIDDTGHRGGRPVFDASLRKYTSWVALQGEDGTYSRRYFEKTEADYFRNWHWMHRFTMAGRTNIGFRRGMWTMIRIRLRDILSTPIPAAVGLAGIPDGHGGASPATIGDCFTSEEAVGMLLRWHIYLPVEICSAAGAGPASSRPSPPPDSTEMPAHRRPGARTTRTR